MLAAFLSGGCSLTLMAPVVVEGQNFQLERTPQLRADMGPDQVETLLGAPLRLVTRGETVVWSYDVRRQLRDCRFYLGPIPLEPVRTERHTLELTFGVTGLERAVYREEAPDRKLERVLGGGSAAAG